MSMTLGTSSRRISSRKHVGEQAYTRCIAPWAIEACDKAILHRVAGDEENGNSRGGGLGRVRRHGRAGCDDHGYLTVDEFEGHRRKSVELTFGPAIFNGHVLPFDVAGFLQAAPECSHEPSKGLGRCAVEKPDHRHRRLLRTRRERPRNSGAAENRDKLAPFHPLIPSPRIMGTIAGQARASQQNPLAYVPV